jgi:gamma-polyglutamate synthase
MQDKVQIELLLFLITIFLIGLIVESIMHNRRVKAIPLRISVSGTRGKTTVVRMLASILRVSGLNVLAKTTGTEALYILPDGTHEKLRRIGLANILEQKAMIKKACKANAECLLTEIMSIQAENHWVESQKLVRPHYTIICNFRPDHLDAAVDGNTSSLFMNDIYPGSTVILPSGEMNKELDNEAIKSGVNIVLADSDGLSDQNLLLAQTMAAELEISPDHIREGIEKYEMDRGQLTAYEFKKDGRRIVFVNAFAANDPVSSSILIDKIQAGSDLLEPRIIGLFSFRMDRGERSKQWLDYLRSGGADRFSQMYFMGLHGQVIKRRLRRGEMIHSKSPDEIMDEIIDQIGDQIQNGICGDTLVFGLVNIQSLGLKLLNHWEQNGRKIDLTGKDVL